MRNVLMSLLLVSSLGACATVSMVSTEATVETGISSEQSSLRKISSAYIEQAERKSWIAKNKGLLGFAKVLMDGSSKDGEAKTASYTQNLQDQAAATNQQISLLTTDIESAAHGLDVATMEANKLLDSDQTHKGLRADLVSYESALVTAKKARRTFVTTLTEVDSEGVYADAVNTAIGTFDTSIDNARKAADRLADYAAEKKNEATS